MFAATVPRPPSTDISRLPPATVKSEVRAVLKVTSAAPEITTRPAPALVTSAAP